MDPDRRNAVSNEEMAAASLHSGRIYSLAVLALLHGGILDEQRS